MISRPDENVTQSEIEKSKERTGNIRKGIETVGALATGGGALGAAVKGGKSISKILPFLSEYIPEDLAYKGINKVMPGVGTFLKDGMKQGLSLKSGLDFIKEQFSQSQQKEQAKKKGNIIEQYSPELHQFISQEIAGGRKPIEAAAIAQHDKRFSNVISKLSKDHKIPWSNIIESVYGSEPQALQENQQQQSGNSGQMGQNQPQTGDEAIMAAFEKLMKM